MNILEHLAQQNIFSLKLLSVDVSITGGVITLWLSAAAVFVFYLIASRQLLIVPRTIQNIAEVIIVFVRDEIASQIPQRPENWLPFLVTLFSFLLANNLIGLIPGVTSATANINTTATLAIIVFIVVQVTAIIYHGFSGYLKSFMPSGVPLAIAIFMVPVEIVSQLARPFSLAVRLFANIFAGHAVTLILISLIFVFKSYLIAPLPLLGTALVLAFEIFIGAIQAFIFTYLSAMYIGSALSETH